MSKDSESEPGYKASLNLPTTDFPMRANLVEREPQRLAAWEKAGLYGKIQETRKNAGGEKFVLHDGPPFANGDVHMGTALNKVLKDLVVKSRTMAGCHAPYVPGWDCHGLPIEFKVVKESRGLSPVEIRKRSEEYARKYIDIQRKSFRRLGVLGDWEHPYLTLDPSYEAEIMRAFAVLVEKGLIYRSKKPVLWSYGAHTALAEAEVEYRDRTDPAIFVKMPITKGRFADGASYVIWTTTPWTLPANLAIAVHPRFTYVRGIFAHEDGRKEHLVIAKSRLDSFAQSTGFKLENAGAAEEIRGEELDGARVAHPFLDRESKVINGEFVTDDTGTGAVHVAPGHGMDDYVAGQQNGLEILSPVDDLGNFTAEAGLDELTGVHVFKANARIIEILREKGALLGEEVYEHSYPHCWRSKTPIIFRAVEQFFLRIDDVRKTALEEIDKVDWIPRSSRNRIYGTVEARPDWCISRQRTWGVPLPVFFTAGGETLIDSGVARKVADLVEDHGTNIWFELDDAAMAEKLGLPEGTKRCHDTLDVWIDSGVSWLAVAGKHPELHLPADVYLEATDQHRGWFQSSLMMSVALEGRAPYKHVITHGFVVDKDSKKKISKSDEGKKSKPMDAEHFVGKYGADILRLWVSSVDYRHDVPFSEDLFAQTSDTYRRMRNTLRILMANLCDFDAATHTVSRDEFTLIDRWILERLNAVTKECLRGYGDWEFRKVFNALNQFCAVDLSSLFVDITKDRMYCNAPGDRRRRSTQTVMARVFDSLARLLAPILVYTADEAWEFAGRDASVHLQVFPEPDAAFDTPEATPVVEELLQLRAVIQQEIETARQQKVIGSNLEASVVLDVAASPKLDGVLEDLETLQEFFILSDLTVNRGAGEAAAVARVTRTKYEKCARCWKHESTVGDSPDHPEICARCADVMADFDAGAAKV